VGGALSSCGAGGRSSIVRHRPGRHRHPAPAPPRGRDHEARLRRSRARGLAVGESVEDTYRVLDEVAHTLPAERPRYLMGVGTPADLERGIAAGIDMFDCVMPTRNARNGYLFASQGRVNIANAPVPDRPGRSTRRARARRAGLTPAPTCDISTLRKRSFTAARNPAQPHVLRPSRPRAARPDPGGGSACLTLPAPSATNPCFFR